MYAKEQMKGMEQVGRGGGGKMSGMGGGGVK